MMEMSPPWSLGRARSPSELRLGAPREEDQHPHPASHGRERRLSFVDTSLVSQIYTLIFLH